MQEIQQTDRQQTERQREPKDAGLIIMLLLLVVGTLFMAWVADNSIPGARPSAIAERGIETIPGP